MGVIGTGARTVFDATFFFSLSVQKWLIAKAGGLEAFSKAMAKWKKAETALLQRLVLAGMSEEKAQKVGRSACFRGYNIVG